MTRAQSSQPLRQVVTLIRVASGAALIAVLAYGYLLRVQAGDPGLLDYFGYFTNLTSALAAVVLVMSGLPEILPSRIPMWLATARGVITACSVVVAIVYYGFAPGDGSAPAWLSTILHGVLPVVLTMDWLLIGDRPRLSWRSLLLVLPYPSLWLIWVLARGITDGWVPYGFLLPGRGVTSLLLHVAALFALFLAAGALVWAASRLPGAWLHREMNERFLEPA